MNSLIESKNLEKEEVEKFKFKKKKKNKTVYNEIKKGPQFWRIIGPVPTRNRPELSSSFKVFLVCKLKAVLIIYIVQ